MIKIKRNKDGFTLLETIIAISIIGILIILTFTFFAYGNQSYSKGRDQYEAQTDVRLALDYLSKQLRYATDFEMIDTIPTLQDSDPYDYIYINGGSIKYSEYVPSNTRINSSFGNSISSTSYLTSTRLIASRNQMINFHITANEGANTQFNITSEISLPNINLNFSKKSQEDTVQSDNIIGVKFLKNYVIESTAPDDGDGTGGSGGDEDSTPQTAYEEVYVTVNIKNNQTYTITLKRLDTNLTISFPEEIINNETQYKVKFSNIVSIENSTPIEYEYTIVRDNGNVILRQENFIPANNPDIIFTHN